MKLELLLTCFGQQKPRTRRGPGSSNHDLENGASCYRMCFAPASFSHTICKVRVETAMGDIKQMIRRMEQENLQRKQHIIDALQKGQETSAMFALEGFLKDEAYVEGLILLEDICRIFLMNLEEIRMHKKCPERLKAVVCSIIYGAIICQNEIKDFADVLRQLTMKYGKPFVGKIKADYPSLPINKSLKGKLEMKTPPFEVREARLQQMAKDAGITVGNDHLEDPTADGTRSDYEGRVWETRSDYHPPPWDLFLSRSLNDTANCHSTDKLNLGAADSPAHVRRPHQYVLPKQVEEESENGSPCDKAIDHAFLFEVGGVDVSGATETTERFYERQNSTASDISITGEPLVPPTPPPPLSAMMLAHQQSLRAMALEAKRRAGEATSRDFELSKIAERTSHRGRTISQIPLVDR